MSKSFKEKLADARRPRRVVSICFRGDLVAEVQRLEDELEAEQLSAGPPRQGETGRNEAAAQQLEDLRSEMRAESETFELEAMSAHEWRSLKAEHPVGDKPSAMDNVLGADTTPFFNAAIRQSIITPKVDDEDWERMTNADAGVLTDGEWSKLVEAVYALNEQPVSIPFSSRAFTILRTQSPDSDSPKRQAEPPA